MSSAEDMGPLTVSPSASPSSSAPEEFPVEPQRVEGNEPDTSVSIPVHPTSGEINASASPEEPPLEPGEDEACAPLSTKPLPKVNAVAHEVQVRATGARPGNVAGERELFTESTSTVLVFEKGAVIRLAAAVTPGQLLFLTNEESKREVVAQVMRKRTFRPTECYVELEFTEPAPGFWGMKFSAATALLPKDAAQVAAAELVASAETTTDELGEPPSPPSAEEVLVLKKEVDALRSQLKLLQTQPAAELGVPGTAIPDAGSLFVTSVPRVDAPSAAGGPNPGVATTVKSPSIESEPQPAPMTAAHQEFMPQPALDFRVSLPKRKRSFRARGNFTPGFRAGALRLVLLVMALLATMTGAAWYKHWLPGMHESKKIPVASWAGGVTTIKPMPGVQAPLPGISQAQTGNSELGKDPPASSNAVSKTPVTSNETERQVTASNNPGGDSSLPRQAGGHAVTRGKPTLSASKTDRSSVHAPAMTLADSVPSSVEGSVVVPPKLIRSVRAAASLEDLRDFETGSVLIDAVIDTEGDVKSINVLSGPPSLRRPALEALKNYKYEPATRNGKPVPARVTIRIQFHFE